MSDKNNFIIRTVLKYIVLFLIFGVFYYSIESIFVGYSNWSSLLMGGISGVLISCINYFYSYSTPKWKQISLVIIIITFIELVTGLILKAFGIVFWNYSNKFMNVEGVICLQSFLYWCILSPVALPLEDFIDYVYFNGEKPDGFMVYMKKLFTGK